MDDVVDVLDEQPDPVGLRLAPALHRLTDHAPAAWVDVSEALLAVRTPPGLANAVAITIDRAQIPEIVATLAGDDTIFVLSRSPADRRKVRRLLEGYL